jgi:hypothetical protein
MPNESTRRLARIEKRELSDVPPHWTEQERGQHLWRLLVDKGIDPGRLYSVQYYPERHCWLLSQETETASSRLPPRRSISGKEGELFYLQALAELRRTAKSAFGDQAARSSHFARNGCKYELPSTPQETSPRELARQLGGEAREVHIRFTSEGGWYPVAAGE